MPAATFNPVWPCRLIGCSSIGVGRPADQEITAAADADRGVGGIDAAIAAGEFAAPKPAARRIHRPRNLGLLGNAEIEADAAHGGDIVARPPAFAFEDALQAGHRADHEADILTAMA